MVDKALIILIFSFFIQSCLSKEDYLPKDKVALVYTELLMAESYAESIATDSTANHTLDSIQKGIFSYYKTDSNQLASSIKHYSSNDEDMRWIFDSVSTQIDSFQSISRP